MNKQKFIDCAFDKTKDLNDFARLSDAELRRQKRRDRNIKNHSSTTKNIS